MRTKNLTTIILVAVLLVAGSCKKDPPEPTPLPEPPPTKEVYVYSEDQPCEVESIDSNGTVIFNKLPDGQKLKGGDIIVACPTKNAPNGFLFKVKTVSSSGGKTTVTTELATIGDAVKDAVISETIHLNKYVGRIEYSEGNTVMQANSQALQAVEKPVDPAVTKAGEKMTLPIGINQIVPLDGGVSAKLEGTIEINMTANFDLTIDDWRLKYFKFTVTPEITSTITLDFEGEIKAEQRINIANVRYNPVTIKAGKVPIVLVPEVAVDIVVDINGAAKIMATLVDASYQSVYGVENKDGKYSAIDENKSHPTNYLEDEALMLDGEMKIQPQLSVSLLFYGVAGLNVYGGMPVKLITDRLKYDTSEKYGSEEENPRMNLSHGMEFELELKSKILSTNLSDWNTKFTSHNWPVWERKVFPEFENMNFSNQDASSINITADVKGWSFIFPTVQHGFCWGTAPMPTVNNNKKEFGKLEFVDGLKSIATTITNLEGKTTYYVRPFFVNYFGVFYGQETSFSLGSPVITLNPVSLSFGDVTTNTGKQLEIIVRNTGDETLKISTITSSDPAFTVSSSATTLLPNEEGIALVTFSPLQEKNYSGTLTIQSNATEKTKTVTVKGRGVAPPRPVITLYPASLSFGNVTPNTSELQQIIIKNTGNAMLEISSVTSLNPAFTVSCAVSTLLPNEEEIMNVTFSPTQEMSYSGTLTIQSNTAEKTNTVPLTGKGAVQTLVAIKNPSVETGNSNNTLPANWSTNTWGTHTAKFTYLLNEGHTGNRSVRVDVSGYASGDAKWMFESLTLEPGGDYIFSDWYKSNVDTEVVLAITNTAGQQDYYDLPFVPKSTVWAKYEASFTMPKNGVRATVYHLLKHNGYLITDDYQIVHYKYKGFDRGMVTITFDDGWEENPETALPVMKQYGFKSTQYYATTYIKDTPWHPHPWPKQQIQKFIDAGHEIGSHTVTHPWLTTLTEQNLIRELADSKQYLENFLGIPIRHFASSYGDYNLFVKDKIMQYYDSHRTVNAGYNSKDNLDYSQLKNMCVLLTTPIGEFEEWVKKAREEKLWLIFLYHRVGGKEAPTVNDTTPEKFAQQMKLLHDYGIEVVTISEALEKIKNQ